MSQQLITVVSSQRVFVHAALKTKWKLTATDSSAQAMKIAEKNCNFHNRNDIELMVGNVITSMVRIPDLVVGHMPCIDETMKSKLKEGSLKDSSDPFAYKEPDVALFCGEDGNFWIKSFIYYIFYYHTYRNHIISKFRG